MHPITHGLTGWVVANSANIDRRDRTIVTVAALIADVDGLGAIAELATRESERPLLWWSDYHHVLCHNVGFALLLVGAAALLSVRRVTTSLLAMFVFHLHLFGDLVGSRGPDGYQWPIPYLLPFSDEGSLIWSGQWELNAWPNIALTAVLIATTLVLAWRRGFSPLELISRRADRALVRALRNRFGQPRR